MHLLPTIHFFTRLVDVIASLNELLISFYWRRGKISFLTVSKLLATENMMMAMGCSRKSFSKSSVKTSRQESGAFSKTYPEPR